MRLLGNIAQLITHSFGRTVRLAEHARLAAIGELASGIAHELRTPLTTIGLALDHLRRQGLPSGAARRLELAVGESARMRRLLEEILLYAKPLSLRLKRLELCAFVARFVDDNQHFASRRGQKLVLTDRPRQAWILGDADRMTQVLANLTLNACEAAPEGAVIRWRLSEDGVSGSVTAEVENAGPAIPPEMMDRVMEPFFSTKPSGTGLGLAIVRRLVEAQGGDISIRSSVERGTRVRLSFPRAEDAAI
jgi:signal transduction histidine kinase